MKVLIGILLFVYLQNSYSGEMNGVKFEKFKNFNKKWQLITVRFRKDTNEMRYTYANDIAAKVLRNDSIDYPDGAIFGKVGVMTGVDPAFESSQVPLGARRYQLMIKDKKKYKNTGGWGFALFDSSGNKFPENESTQSEACFACHDIVQDRGYVFSQEMEFHQKKIEVIKNRVQFETLNRADLPASLLKEIPENFKYIRSLKGLLQVKLFQGTLEEIRPTLSREALNSKYPTILLSEDKNRWSLVYPEQLGVKCFENDKPGMFMRSLYTKSETLNEKHELHFCYAD